MELSELNFITKEQYFTWRDAWRNEYMKLSQIIRDNKKLRMIYAKGNNKPIMAGYVQSDLVRQAVVATELLAIRAESKIKAGQQRQSRLALEALAAAA